MAFRPSGGLDPRVKLFDSDDDADSTEHVLRINQAYADHYNNFRRNEELEKIKNKPELAVSSSSDDDESEVSDEDLAKLWTDEQELDFLKTISAITRDDPKIYDKESSFFKSSYTDSTKSEKQVKKKEKKMTVKDFEMKVLREKGPEGFYESESEDERQFDELSYKQQQEQLKKDLIDAQEGDSSDDEGGLMSERQKTAEQLDAEDAEYTEWLKGNKMDLTEEQNKSDLDALRTVWSDPKLDKDEQFLRDYLLDKAYKGDKESENYIPTYMELVGRDDDIVNEAEDHEYAYNMRFENDPEAKYTLHTFPRSLPNTVKAADTSRAEKRAAVKKRKEEERKQREEELKMAKKLKRDEIFEKIERLKKITGNQRLAFDTVDLDADFDPEKYDKMMQGAFDEEYYGEEGDEKPEFDNDDDFDLEDEAPQNWDEWVAGNQTSETAPEAGYHVDATDAIFEEEDINMDADYDPTKSVPRESKRHKKKSRCQRKLGAKLHSALDQEKPVFDPDEKSFAEYVDEYYGFDYEDMIDDMPCRFKYRRVLPCDYGLSTEEVLKANEKQLNAWVSVKRMSQHRTEEDELQTQKNYSHRAKTAKKQQILSSLYESGDDSKSEKQSEEQPASKKSKKAKKKKAKDSLTEGIITVDKPKKKKRKSVVGTHADAEDNVSHAKSKKSKGKKEAIKEDDDSVDDEPIKKKKIKEKPVEPTGTFVFKKKKKKVRDIDSGMKMEGKETDKSVKEEMSSIDKSKKKRKKEKEKSAGEIVAWSTSDSRLSSFGFNPKRVRYAVTAKNS